MSDSSNWRPSATWAELLASTTPLTPYDISHTPGLHEQFDAIVVHEAENGALRPSGVIRVHNLVWPQRDRVRLQRWLGPASEALTADTLVDTRWGLMEELSAQELGITYDGDTEREQVLVSMFFKGFVKWA